MASAGRRLDESAGAAGYGNASCAVGLTGSFCMLCEAKGQVYERASSSTGLPTCVECAEVGPYGVIGTAVLVTFGAAASALVALVALEMLRRCLPRRLQTRLGRLWRASKPANKLKICIGFCVQA